MTNGDLQASVQRDFGPFLASCALSAQGEAVAVVKAESYVELMKSLKDRPEYAFDHLSCLTAVDMPPASKILLVCHLWSYRYKHQMTVKTETDRTAPKAPTLTGLWQGANWFEREVFDLYGVVFEGHPDLRRLMMPDDYKKHPLRKDFTDDGYIPKPN